MRKHIKALTMLMSLLLVVAFLPGCAGAADGKMPEELQAIADEALSIASSFAKQLDGEWGDWHDGLVNSKEGDAFGDYENMREVLCGFVEESDVVYLYAIYPSGPIDSASFFITVDGSEDPDEYGTEYEWESGFATAWKGTPMAQDYFWEDDEDGDLLLISAYAPVHDSKGNVVAILGIDYPAPEAANYPDWIAE
ncbi:MAG: hypothetical protein FWE55_01180 [Synergistaceae bacterium]|nr:hypothetical protein [Synergistaceae bacterium]